MLYIYIHIKHIFYLFVCTTVFISIIGSISLVQRQTLGHIGGRGGAVDPYWIEIQNIVNR